LNSTPDLSVKLDTEIRMEDLENNNLIVVGGPVVNAITEKFNAKLPIKFDEEKIGELFQQSLEKNMIQMK